MCGPASQFRHTKCEYEAAIDIGGTRLTSEWYHEIGLAGQEVLVPREDGATVRGTTHT
jgi:hypothetical protein